MDGITEEITRFDVPVVVRRFLEVAVEEGVVDYTDMYTLGANFGTDWKGMIDLVVEWAYTWIHTDISKHKKVVQAAEQYWQTLFPGEIQ